MKKTIAILLIAIMALGAISTFDVVVAQPGYHPGQHHNPCIVRIWVKPHWVWLHHHKVWVKGHWAFINICKPHHPPYPHPGPHPIGPPHPGPHPGPQPGPHLNGPHQGSQPTGPHNGGATIINPNPVTITGSH